MEEPQAISEATLDVPSGNVQQRPSVIFGSKTPALLEITIGALIENNARKYGARDAVVFPWQSIRMSYRNLAQRSREVAARLTQAGLQHGDCLAIMAGNRHEYIETFLGGARLGCPVVVMNSMFSPEELKQALVRVECKLLIIAPIIGQRSLSEHISKVLSNTKPDAGLQTIVILGESDVPQSDTRVHCYSRFFPSVLSQADSTALEAAEKRVSNWDVLNLQFTSVMGFLASFCHGSSIIFPSDTFNAEKVLDAVVREKATALLGVPTMFIAELDELTEKSRPITTIRTGLAAGSAVPPSLMESLRKRMNIQSMLIAYGMTETSPVTFITALDDSEENMFNSIGKVLPHTGAKIVDGDGKVVPVGTRGEICTSGFALQKGYWQDEAKTREVMRQDDEGIVWMHTGDEGFIDSDGYGHITGRIKDLIIRGGENISPGEIEDRLLQNPAIGECCVVGLDDHKYGEAVSCFLKPANGRTTRPSDDEVRNWVKQKLGRHKEPKHIFWIGDVDVGQDIPKTGSGKYQKHLVRALGNSLVKKMGRSLAKL
ncbi:hypothetical protein AK830_g9063 [Neonectria ditissima]|uniref:Acyl-CoA synthetase YngI n=1 Tax=Neonectria ditissima TaxID=78410 RepID=A0A0N8H5Z2_9HYPO|nr:hypothetical protein AK830_g9063 [Neonectria ditissima]